MSQEYTEDKNITLKKLSSYRRLLLKSMLIIMGIFAFYLMVALVSFSPSDPSWSQTAWHGPIQNLGGKVGSWVADTMFFTFGILAYALPPIMLFFCWGIFAQRDRRDYVDLFCLSLRLIGILALLLTSCGLAALNVDDLYYFASGGVIGSLLSNAILPRFNSIGATFVLLCIWVSGLTLFTGWSWLTIVEKIGAVVLEYLTFISNHSRRDDEKDNVSCHSRAAQDYEDDVHCFGDSEVLLLHPFAAQKSSPDPLLRPSSAAAISTHQSEVAQSDHGLSRPSIGVYTQSEQPRDNLLSIHLSAGSSAPPKALARALEASTMSPAACATGQIGVDGTRVNYPEHGAWAEQESRAGSFILAFSASDNDYNSQIKQGIGPELPRPKPVRIPTRRELSSYGVKIPSQHCQQRHRYSDVAQLGLNSDLEGVTTSPLLMIPSNSCHHGAEFVTGHYHGHESWFASTDDDNSGCMDCQHEKDFTALNTRFMPFSYDECWQSAAPSDDNSWPDKDASWNDDDNESLQDNHFSQITALQIPTMDSLIHPFLMRHQEQPRQKPSTPLPTVDLLMLPREEEPVNMVALEQTARLVEARLADYHIKAEVIGILPGPVITSFELNLAPGVKAARISNLARDLARSLSAMAVRVVEVIPGKPYVGLELPNKQRQTVYLRGVLDCKQFRDTSSPLTLVLGQDICGQPVIADLGKMPHLLVAGTTGSGKSVGVNAMILSILYKATPKEVRFIMIDPKMLELSVYEGIPHLLTEVVTDMKDAANALHWCVDEMERRYKLMSLLGVRNLASYNKRIEQADAMGRPVPDPFWKPGDGIAETPPMLEKLSYIVVMVDEFADLMMAVGKKVEELIARLAQKARAAGIHLVLATQRPSVDVITGLIKANIPTRIAFTVSSKVDSRTILDQTGAESLLGMGDMLYLASNSSLPVRVHGAFVRDEEVHAVVNDWKARGRPQYINSITSICDDSEGGGLDGDEELDLLFNQAVAFVIDKRRVSISSVQRQFHIGYNRAARIVEQMELQGIVSSPGHHGNREVLVHTVTGAAIKSEPACKDT